MSLQGLVLNCRQIQLLNESIAKMSKTTLRGIPTFSSFSWNGFSKGEFISLVSLANAIFPKLFQNFGPKYPFVFNFNTGFIEMDIVTVASLKGCPILIDFESKNGKDEDLQDKLRKQVDKRMEELPRLVKNRAYLVLGFVNDEYVEGVFSDGEKSRLISNWESVAKLCLSLEPFADVESFLAQISTIAAITDIVPMIKKGKYAYFSDTDGHYRDIVAKIGKVNAFVVSGRAGTGKTVLAVRLFLSQQNTKFLLVNSKLYYTLGFERKHYAEKRATFSTKDFLSWISSDTISVVDEYQRLPLEDIAQIIKRSKTTFLFGDFKQAFEERSTDIPPEELRNILSKDYGFSVEIKKLSKAKRYCDEVEHALSLLTSQNAPKGKVAYLPLGYSINLFYDEQDFLRRYHEVEGVKKIFVPVNQTNVNEIKIGNETFRKAARTHDAFSAFDDWPNIFGSTYHALSFDVDHSFVYLNQIHLLRRGNGENLFYQGSCLETDLRKMDRFLNELNVLFTRGKKSLNIYVSDIVVYFCLRQRLFGKVARIRGNSK